jgi:glycosyltransferase involved in cell wall biosynthesis
MRVLHVVKTSDGAPWAAWQAGQLTKLGVEIHVALPSLSGSQVNKWKKAGAHIHLAPLDFPARTPWRFPAMCRLARKLVAELSPHIIHSHFVGTTLTLRYALGRDHRVPRIFQVAGPLHLEHALYRRLELSSAGKNDYWICSSKCIRRLLQEHGIPSSRLFLSYYGWPVSDFADRRTNVLRNRLGIGRNQLVVGNISWLYKPKYYLGQTVGLKCHEDLIDALSIVIRKRRDVVGVLVGGAFADAHWYEDKMRARAKIGSGDRIKMPGALDHSIVQKAWPDFDCVIHVPLSENCGGVVEPLLAGVPTIAGKVGGLPEVVIDDVTGRLVPPRNPVHLADAILEHLDNINHFRMLASTGKSLVRKMFDIGRTAQEIYGIYEYLLHQSAGPPPTYDSELEVQRLRGVLSC